MAKVFANVCLWHLFYNVYVSYFCNHKQLTFVSDLHLIQVVCQNKKSIQVGKLLFLVCVSVCVHERVFVTYKDTNLYNDMCMTGFRRM